MAYRFNPAPGWPAPPEGWSPPEGWQPDPAWPPAPEGWNFWVWQEDESAEELPADEHAATNQGITQVLPTPLEESGPGPAEETDPGVPEVVEPLPPQAAQPPEAALPEDEPVVQTPQETSPEEPAHAGAESAADSAPLTPEPPIVPEDTEAHPPVVVSDSPLGDLPADTADDVPMADEAPASTEPQPGWGQPAAEQSWAQPAEPSPQQWGEPAAAPSQQAWGQQQPQPPQYAPTTAHQGHTAHQPAPPPTPRKKKGKGLLITLIVLAVILAGAFVWGLLGSLGPAAASPAQEPLATTPPPAPEPTVVDAKVEPVEADAAPEQQEADEALTLEQLAAEAGLMELFAAQAEYDVEPVNLDSGAIALSPADSAHMTTFMVGPAATLMEQDVGELRIDEVTRTWSPDESMGMPCPEPAPGNEYIKLSIAADTGVALQDYPFTGLEIRFFDDAGEQTGVVNPLLTAICLGENEAITSAWARGGGHTGGVLAEVGPGTTTVAYSAIWALGINDTAYSWALEEF